jgi:putative transposase
MPTSNSTNRNRHKVHFARNVTQRLGSARSKPVNALVLTIFAQTTPEAVIAQYHRVTASLRASFPENTTMLQTAEPDLTAFASLPREHWQKVWPNNPIERLNRDIKRRATSSRSSRPRLPHMPHRRRPARKARNGNTANAATSPTSRYASSSTSSHDHTEPANAKLLLTA